MCNCGGKRPNGVKKRGHSGLKKAPTVTTGILPTQPVTPDKPKVS